MGAIFGIFGQHDPQDVSRMGERLRHRGARITVRPIADDLSVGAVGRDTGAMICTTEDRVVVGDCTLYNSQALSQRPAAPTGTLSQAEVIHRLHLANSPGALASINGDFAVALIDRTKSTISFARDYFGCRPLYACAYGERGVAFASEYKALLALDGLKPAVDRDMVQYLQCAKKLPVGRTLLKQILEIPPGALSTWTGGRLQPLEEVPPLEVDIKVRAESQAIDLIRKLLREALEERVRDLDDVGLALSGGIDSIALAFLLRELRPNGVIHTFTAGSGPDDHEMSTAARVARAIGSTHHEVITPPQLIKDDLVSYVWHLEDPFSRSEGLQLFEVGRAAAGHVDVLLSAQGADGLFAGMPRHRLIWLAGRLPMFRQGLEEFFNLTQFGLQPGTPLGRLLDYLKYRGKVPRVPIVPGATFPAATRFPAAGPELVNRAAVQGLQAGICQDIHKFERSFAAFGIEYRPPFYDLKFVRAAYTITDRLKITPKTQKYIFRKAMETIVPDEFRHIPKYPQRMHYDLEFSEVLDEVGKHYLLEEGPASARGLFEEPSLENLFRTSSQVVYRDEAAMRIFTALMTEMWLRLFVDQVPQKNQIGIATLQKPGGVTATARTS